MNTLVGPDQGQGRLPNGQCPDRWVHDRHIYHSKTLGTFMCRGVEEEDD